MWRVGILLTGCGAHDGTDPLEAAFLAAALDRHGLRPQWFAPSGRQHDVVDHLAGAVDAGAPARRIDQESARLARGAVIPFEEGGVSGLGALVIPGGYGVVKNLIVGALVTGRRAELRPEVAGPLAALARRGVPLGAIGLGLEVLSRLDDGFSIEPFGVPPQTAVVDDVRRRAWAPGFLGTERAAHAAAGIDEMVKALARMMGRPAALPG